MRNPYDIIHSVLVTEKATDLAGELDKYTFKVATDANKVEIRQAVESLFDVKVSSVNTMNRLGKRKRMRTGKVGQRADVKRAIVTLSEGEIDIF